MDRRKFLGSMAAIGVGSALLPVSGAAALPEAPRKHDPLRRKGPFHLDENLVCIISDLHVRPGKYQEERFAAITEDILSLNPRPLNVLCLGDVAYLTGKPEEYAAVKPFFDKLTAAGMKLTVTMGNHDRRSRFADAFPELASARELPGRYVYTVSTPRADFILMDSLQEGEDAEKWITPGALDDAQREWLAAKLEASGSKPLFVMAHHNIKETKLKDALLRCPACVGYIYGHEHIWDTGWIRKNYKERCMLRTLCVPSTGHWGDIGYTLMRLEENRAVASLIHREFFFPKPLKEGEVKPDIWTEIENERAGATCVFPYTRP